MSDRPSLHARAGKCPEVDEFSCMTSQQRQPCDNLRCQSCTPTIHAEASATRYGVRNGKPSSIGILGQKPNEP